TQLDQCGDYLRCILEKGQRPCDGGAEALVRVTPIVEKDGNRTLVSKVPETVQGAFPRLSVGCLVEHGRDRFKRFVAERVVRLTKATQDVASKLLLRRIGTYTEPDARLQHLTRMPVADHADVRPVRVVLIAVAIPIRVRQH